MLAISPTIIAHLVRAKQTSTPDDLCLLESPPKREANNETNSKRGYIVERECTEFLEF